MTLNMAFYRQFIPLLTFMLCIFSGNVLAQDLTSVMGGLSERIIGGVGSENTNQLILLPFTNKTNPEEKQIGNQLRNQLFLAIQAQFPPFSPKIQPNTADLNALSLSGEYQVIVRQNGRRFVNLFIHVESTNGQLLAEGVLIAMDQNIKTRFGKSLTEKVMQEPEVATSPYGSDLEPEDLIIENAEKPWAAKALLSGSVIMAISAFYCAETADKYKSQEESASNSARNDSDYTQSLRSSNEAASYHESYEQYKTYSEISAYTSVALFITSIFFWDWDEAPEPAQVSSWQVTPKHGQIPFQIAYQYKW